MIKVFNDLDDIPVKFTGVCKITDSGNIYHLKNGEHHRENGPAIIRENGDKFWCINGLEHREDGPALMFENGDKFWVFKNKFYGKNDHFTNETWIEFVENLKREEELEIFK